MTTRMLSCNTVVVQPGHVETATERPVCTQCEVTALYILDPSEDGSDWSRAQTPTIPRPHSSLCISHAIRHITRSSPPALGLSRRSNPAQSFAFGVLAWPALAPPCSPAAAAASHTARISRRACTMRCLNLAVEVAEHDCLDSIPNLTRYGPARSTVSISLVPSRKSI
jgi:hypothetical protein